MGGRILTWSQLLYLLPLVVLAALLSVFERPLGRFLERSGLWRRVALALAGFVVFGFGVGMGIGHLLPDGFLRAWSEPGDTSAAREAAFIFAYNLVAYFVFIPVANLFRMRSIPYGLILYWTHAWGWGMVIGSGSLVGPPLTLAEGLEGFARVVFWEFFAGALTWAATYPHYRWHSRSWIRGGGKVECFSYRLSREEVIALVVALFSLLFAAWQEALVVAAR